MALSARQSPALPQRQGSAAESRLCEAPSPWGQLEAAVMGPAIDMTCGLKCGQERRNLQFASNINAW
jgi:hypothetical protein